MSVDAPVRRGAEAPPPGGGRLAARCVWLDPDHWLAPGEIVWDAAGRIVSLRRARGAVRDVAVLPGLVNAHVHLQIEALPDAPRGFLPWVGAVMHARAAATPAALRAAARRALGELAADGVAAVGEFDSTGASHAEIVRAGLAGRCYQELTGFHLEGAGARQLVRQRRHRASRGLAAGLSPHAPYSVSAALFRAAAAACRHLAVHCAEVPEEQQFLRDGTGPFAALLQRLGRLPAGYRAGRVGAVRWLERLGVLRASTQLVHCQELERGDAARIANAGASVVVCPGTIAWFGRTPPPVPSWLRTGIAVGLGTDSRASNAAFSLRAELQAAARFWPQLSPRDLFAMATTHGARSLGLPGLGRLRRTGRADFMMVPMGEDGPEAVLDRFVHGAAVPCGVVRAGVRLAAPGRLRR